jgi:lysozyme
MNANTGKHLSSQGARFTAGFEGCVLYPYNDPWNATIGIGHLIHHGVVTEADIRRYRGFTLNDAYALLKGDVANAEDAIRAHITTELNQNEWDALVDLVFNCGASVLDGTIADDINRRDFAAAASAWQAWCHGDGGIVLEGLVRRRQAERELFLKPIPAYIPADEARWEHEYDQLEHKHTTWARLRCRILRRTMTKRRKQIWHLGQADHGKGWQELNRGPRYYALLARTEG